MEMTEGCVDPVELIRVVFSREQKLCVFRASGKKRVGMGICVGFVGLSKLSGVVEGLEAFILVKCYPKVSKRKFSSYF